MMVTLALEKKETKGWGKYRSNEGSSSKILLSLVRRSNHNSSDNPDNEVDFEIQDDREGIFPALSNSIAYRENEFPYWDKISESTSASALLGGIGGT